MIGLIKPLPRWVILPDDPPALRRWLLAKATADDVAPEPPEPPDEDEVDWRAA